MTQESKQFVIKARQLYKETQDHATNNKLNKITQQRMRKRYHYMGKEVQKKQALNDLNNIDQIKFYKNQFKKLTLVVEQSMKESYIKNKFQKQVKDILQQNYNNRENQNPINQSRIQEIQNINTISNVQNMNTISNVQNSAKNNQKQFEQSKLDKQKMLQQKKRQTYLSKGTKSQLFNKNYETKYNENNFVHQQQQFPKKYQQRDQIKKSNVFDQFFQKQQKKTSKGIGFKSVLSNNQDDLFLQKRVSQLSFKQLQKNIQKTTQKQKQIQVQQIKSNNFQKEIIYLQNQLIYKQKINNHLKKRIQQYQHKQNKNSNYKSQEESLKLNVKRNDLSQIQNCNKINVGSQLQNKAFLKQKKGICQIVQPKNPKQKSGLNIQQVIKYVSKLGYLSNRVVLLQNSFIIVRLQRNNNNLQSSNYSVDNKYRKNNKQNLTIQVQNNSFFLSQNIICQIQYDFSQKNHSLIVIKSDKKQKVVPKQSKSERNKKNTKDLLVKQDIQIELKQFQALTEQIIIKVKLQLYQKSQTDISQTKKQFLIVLPVTFTQFSSKPFESQSNISKNKIKIEVQANQLFKTLNDFKANTDIDFKKLHHTYLKDEDYQITVFCRTQLKQSNKTIQRNKQQSKVMLGQVQLKWKRKIAQSFKDKDMIEIKAIEQWTYLFAFILMKDQQDLNANGQIRTIIL